MTDNDIELIALNSNDDDIFFLISLRRNHKDHVPRIREYYEEVIPRYTDLQPDLQFRHHFHMSRPTVEQLCQFNFENKSMIRKNQFLCIEVIKIGAKWLVLLIMQG